MKRFVIISIGLLWLIAVALTPVPKHNFTVPDGWPEPVYNFSKNPLSADGILLGRVLFHDPILSADSTISCTSCHLQYTAFTHVDHDLSHGIDGKIGTRNSPALTNLAWGKLFMWDGAINHLDMQPLAPISHPAEMGSDIDTVIAKLRGSHKYRMLFYNTFNDSSITGANFLKAISQFMLTMVSANSKYDRVVRREPGVAFTPQEDNGYKLFRKNCASCHKEPLFTTNEFANNGLAVDTTLNDFGRMKITHNPADSLHFKIPTLRNIEFSYPYMHDGRFKKLQDVIKHYTSGIVHSPTLAPELRKPIILTSNEQVDLLAFLLTLTDKEYLFNQAFSYPRGNVLEQARD